MSYLSALKKLDLDGKPKRRPPTGYDIQIEKSKRAIDRTREQIERAGKLDLQSFMRLGWHVVEPARVFISGWAIDAIADHLAAVSNGDLTRLVINVPPGMTKSLTTCVFWPAWEWGPRGDPSKRFLGFSYDTALSTRDALRCRRLMSSFWYQTLWGDRFKLLDDQNTKTRYENDQTGFRISDYVGGGTGERGDID